MARENKYAKYEVVKEIGSGAFGKVSLRKGRNGDEVAVKKIFLWDDALRRRCFEEIDVLKRLTAIPNSKDYFVQFLDSYEDSEIGGGTSMYIVMEYCKYGTLRDFIKTANGRLLCENSQTVADIIWQLCGALNLMHTQEKPIMHRDLKAANVLVSDIDLESQKISLKLADFGLAREVAYPEGMQMTKCGTPCYMAPEVEKNKRYNKESDVYSLGAIFYNILTGKHPPKRFCADGSGAPKNLEQEVKTKFHCFLPILMGMLNKKPGNRPSLDEIRRKIAPYTGHVVSIRSQIDVNGGNRVRSQSTGRDEHPQIKALKQLNNLAINKLNKPTATATVQIPSAVDALKKSNRDSAFDSGEHKTRSSSRCRHPEYSKDGLCTNCCFRKPSNIGGTGNTAQLSITSDLNNNNDLDRKENRSRKDRERAYLRAAKVNDKPAILPSETSSIDIAKENLRKAKDNAVKLQPKVLADKCKWPFADDMLIKRIGSYSRLNQYGRLLLYGLPFQRDAQELVAVLERFQNGTNIVYLIFEIYWLKISHQLQQKLLIYEPSASERITAKEMPRVKNKQRLVDINSLDALAKSKNDLQYGYRILTKLIRNIGHITPFAYIQSQNQRYRLEQRIDDTIMLFDKDYKNADEIRACLNPLTNNWELQKDARPLEIDEQKQLGQALKYLSKITKFKDQNDWVNTWYPNFCRKRKE